MNQTHFFSQVHKSFRNASQQVNAIGRNDTKTKSQPLQKKNPSPTEHLKFHRVGGKKTVDVQQSPSNQRRINVDASDR